MRTSKNRGNWGDKVPLSPHVPKVYSQADIDAALKAERKALGKWLLKKAKSANAELNADACVEAILALINITMLDIAALEAGKRPEGMK